MAVVYSSAFAGTEDPLSESGHWYTGATGWSHTLKKNTGAYGDGLNYCSRLTDGLPDDQYAEIGYDQDPGGSSWVGVMTRIPSLTNGSGYLAIAHDGALKLYNVVDTGTVAFTLLDSVAASLGTAPRTLRLTSVGNTHTIAFNGVDVLVYTDPVPLYTSGSLGAAASTFGGPTVKLEYFAGGTEVMVEPEPPAPSTAGWPTATIFIPYHALDALHQRGLRADQPAATTVVPGTLYCVTDEGGILERSDGTSWEAYGPTLWSTGAVRFRYVYVTLTTAPPTGNQIRFNAAHPYTSVTTVWVRNMTTDGVDTHGIMLVLTPGTTVYVQDRTTSAHYVVYTMTGDPIDHTDYVELPVTWKSNGTAIPNADNVEVVFIRFET